MLIEFNAFIPDDVSYVQEKDMSVVHGNSLLALVDLGKKKGYELISVNQENAFFVVKEYFPLFNIEDNSIRALKHFSNPLHIFQLYDGTMVVQGSQALYYYGFSFDLNDRIQILPKYLRDAHMPWSNRISKLHKIMYRLFIYLNRDRRVKMHDREQIWGWKTKYESLL